MSTHKKKNRYSPLSLREFMALHALLPVAVCFAAGIWLGDFFGGAGPTMWAWAVLGAAAAGFALRRHAVVAGVALYVAGAATGALFVNIAERSRHVTLPKGATEYAAVVASEPVRRGKVLQCELDVASGPLRGRRIRASVYCGQGATGGTKGAGDNTKTNITAKTAPSPTAPVLRAGMGIVARSALEAPRNHDGSDFDFVRWAQVRGLCATTFLPPCTWRGAAVGLGALPMRERVRLWLLTRRSRLLDAVRPLSTDDDAYAVVAAMSLGDKSGLGREVRAATSATGTSHILALSGLHLSILYGLLLWVAGAWRRRWWVQALVLGATWAFVVFAGMPYGAVRAGIMLTIYGLYTLRSTFSPPLHGLSLAALALLMFDPLCLWDVGFQLSFLSLAGILLLMPPLTRWLIAPLPWRWLRGLAGLALVSCAAQAATLPLSLHYFHVLPLYSALANVVVVPFATVILYLSVLLYATLPIGCAHAAVYWCVERATQGLLLVLREMASWPGCAVHVELGAGETAAAYVCVVAGVLLFRQMRQAVRATCKLRFLRRAGAERPGRGNVFQRFRRRVFGI